MSEIAIVSKVQIHVVLLNRQDDLPHAHTRIFLIHGPVFLLPDGNRWRFRTRLCEIGILGHGFDAVKVIVDTLEVARQGMHEVSPATRTKIALHVMDFPIAPVDQDEDVFAAQVLYGIRQYVALPSTHAPITKITFVVLNKKMLDAFKKAAAAFSS